MANTTLSLREMEVLALAWQCMDTQPKIDMHKLARLTGYTPGSASVTFGNIKRKIKLLGDSVIESGPLTPKKTGGPGRPKGANTPKSGSKRSATANNTPVKRQKKSARRDESEEEEDLDKYEVLAGIKIKKEERIDKDEEDGSLEGISEYGGGV